MEPKRSIAKPFSTFYGIRLIGRRFMWLCGFASGLVRLQVYKEKSCKIL